MASKRALLGLSVLVFLAVFNTIYTVWAYAVASHVFASNGVLYWPTSGYSFLPLPTTPTGIVPQMTQPLNQADQQYYQYVIQTGVLIVVTVLLWVAVLWLVVRFRKASAGKFLTPIHSR